jgi:GWxTD domain-containing protein
MKTKIFLILVLFFNSVICFTQPQGSERFTAFNETGRTSIELLSFPSGKESKSNLIVNTRIPFSFITFTRDPNISRVDFSGSLEVIVEVFDKSNNSVAREIFQKEVSIIETDKKDMRDKFIEASIQFEIKPEEYKIYIECTDKESQKNFKHEIKKYILKDYKTANISDISFITRKNDTENQIRFINRSGNIPFNENVSLISKIANKGTIDSVYITIYKFNQKNKEIFLTQNIDKSFIKKNSSLIQTVKFSPEYSIRNDPDFSLILFPLQSDTIDIGKYLAVLTVKSGSNTDTVQKHFEVFWYNMPVSLFDFKIAQKKLKFITTKEEYDELNSGSRETQLQKFLDYWKKKDPTPKTAYNEVMAEFYRRVDFASINYSTVREIDGSETDRGKIYVLYGKPDKSDRELLPNSAPKEIWLYQNLKKKFIFLDEGRQGTFKLSKVEDL